MRATARLSIPAVFVALVMASACSQRSGSNSAQSANIPGEPPTEALTGLAKIRGPRDLLPVLPTGLWHLQNDKNEAIGKAITSLLSPRLRSRVIGWELFWAGALRSGIKADGDLVVAVFKKRLIAPSPGINPCAIVWLGLEDGDLQGGALLTVVEWGGWQMLSAGAAVYLGMHVLRLEFGQNGPEHVVDFVPTSRGPVIARALRVSDGAWTIFSSDSHRGPVFEVTILETDEKRAAGHAEPEPLDTMAEWRAFATDVSSCREPYTPLDVLGAVREDMETSRAPAGLEACAQGFAILAEHVLLYVFYLDEAALRLQPHTLAELSKECRGTALDATLRDIRRRDEQGSASGGN